MTDEKKIDYNICREYETQITKILISFKNENNSGYYTAENSIHEIKKLIETAKREVAKEILDFFSEKYGILESDYEELRLKYLGDEKGKE